MCTRHTAVKILGCTTASPNTPHFSELKEQLDHLYPNGSFNWHLFLWWTSSCNMHIFSSTNHAAKARPVYKLIFCRTLRRKSGKKSKRMNKHQATAKKVPNNQPLDNVDTICYETQLIRPSTWAHIPTLASLDTVGSTNDTRALSPVSRAPVKKFSLQRSMFFLEQGTCVCFFLIYVKNQCTWTYNSWTRDQLTLQRIL